MNIKFEIFLFFTLLKTDTLTSKRQATTSHAMDHYLNVTIQTAAAAGAAAMVEVDMFKPAYTTPVVVSALMMLVVAVVIALTAIAMIMEIILCPM